MPCFSRLLKNAHLLRCAHHASLRRTRKYASFRMIACKQVSETTRALHLSIFEQPAFIDFFNSRLEHFSVFRSRLHRQAFASLARAMILAKEAGDGGMPVDRTARAASPKTPP